MLRLSPALDVMAHDCGDARRQFEHEPEQAEHDVPLYVDHHPETDENADDADRRRALTPDESEIPGQQEGVENGDRDGVSAQKLEHGNRLPQHQ
ncbi:hypothetical protein RFN25_27550 [Mesorhizobium abyssinicae]|uniref:hypothetical protein n=1 Tax=Mesorhizobium abyssinicae TaxID=1209958 RepID=UPI002A240C62|nr:hypothetical protein [Mesorhizobium abyssinicae]MDX8437183.1 hypothetical protein [Mesorhizobium abyssinicae]